MWSIIRGGGSHDRDFVVDNYGFLIRAFFVLLCFLVSLGFFKLVLDLVCHRGDVIASALGDA